jgi:sterol desaturase/sphingolipid hydroxylase (fatty acid hydroxylase superfamily)
VFSDVFLLFLVACSPIHALFTILGHFTAGPASHSGYEKIRVGGVTVLNAGDFFHQLHHRFFDCNYGTPEVPFDEKFESFHDGTPEGDRQMVQRRRKLAKDRAKIST